MIAAALRHPGRREGARRAGARASHRRRGPRTSSGTATPCACFQPSRQAAGAGRLGSRVAGILPLRWKLELEAKDRRATLTTMRAPDPLSAWDPRPFQLPFPASSAPDDPLLNPPTSTMPAMPLQRSGASTAPHMAPHTPLPPRPPRWSRHHREQPLLVSVRHRRRAARFQRLARLPLAPLHLLRAPSPDRHAQSPSPATTRSTTRPASPRSTSSSKTSPSRPRAPGTTPRRHLRRRPPPRASVRPSARLASRGWNRFRAVRLSTDFRSASSASSGKSPFDEISSTPRRPRLQPLPVGTAGAAVARPAARPAGQDDFAGLQWRRRQQGDPLALLGTPPAPSSSASTNTACRARA